MLINQNVSNQIIIHLPNRLKSWTEIKLFVQLYKTIKIKITYHNNPEPQFNMDQCFTIENYQQTVSNFRLCKRCIVSMNKYKTLTWVFVQLIQNFDLQWLQNYVYTTIKANCSISQ